MHASSLENMQRCYEQYLAQSALLSKPRLRVLDIGGANVNGSYADIFAAPKFTYTAVDMAPGEGVDVVLDDPYKLPFDDGSADIVLSGQCFEHAEFFWLSFAEMARVVGDEGLIFLIVPSGGPIHRYPVDCYRFYPDSMTALAKYADIPLVACWHDNRGPWNDLVAVFSRGFKPDEEVRHLLPWNRYPLPPPDPEAAKAIDKTPEMERIAGAEPYLDTLGRIHRDLAPRGYLEIGVRHGESLAKAHCPAAGIDPKPSLTKELAPQHRLYEMTSDAFFAGSADQALAELPVDLAFIDGMHLFEFALRDFIAVEARAHPASVVIIDDILPNHPRQADRQRVTNMWAGDIWKLHAVLKARRPDLTLLVLDTAPTGLLLVLGLDPDNRTLSETYNPIIANFRDRPFDQRQRPVLERRQVIAPDDARLGRLLKHIATTRETSGDDPAAARKMVRLLCQGLF